MANCFSCSALLCANYVIAHQLIIVFEGHHVSNLGQSANMAADLAGGQGVTSLEAMKKMVKEGKKSLMSSTRLSRAWTTHPLGEIDSEEFPYLPFLDQAH